MNLDDFIFSDNISTPAGLGMSPSPELNKEDSERPVNTVASAIPIKMRKETPQFVVPQSVPAGHHNLRHDEFNYVQRHVRKTSIDERRVSATWIADFYIAFFATQPFIDTDWRSTAPQETSELFPSSTRSQQHTDTTRF